MTDRVISDRIGRIVSSADVRRELHDTLVEWFVTYLAEVERQAGLDAQSIPVPQSYEQPLDVTKIEETFGPTLYVGAPSLATAGMASGTRYESEWTSRVVAIVWAEMTRREIEDRVGLYLSAARAAITQQTTRRGLLDDVRWAREDYAIISTQRRREKMLLAGSTEVTVKVADALNRKGHLGSPPQDPYHPPESITPVSSVTAEVE